MLHDSAKLYGDGEAASIKQADLQPNISLQPHQQRVVDKVQDQLDDTGQARMLLYHSLGSGKTLSGLAAADASHWVPCASR